MPGVLRHVLNRIGFKEKEIVLNTVSEFSLKHDVSIRYNRGFCAVINMPLGKYKIGYGAFGGSNQNFKTIVDDCDYKFKLPKYYAVIKGEHRGNNVYAQLYMRSDADLPNSLNDESFDYRVYKLMKIYKLYTGAERREKLFTASTMDLHAAIKESMLAARKNGYKITKRGKKFIKRFEEMNPTKKLG